MEQTKYDKLRGQYPEYVSLDQVHRICRIAKRTASYLVVNGIIPAVDTGRKTWRYKIALEDVIDYLVQRNQVGSMIPRGATSSRRGKRKSFSQTTESECGSDIVDYFRSIYTEYEDVLTVADIVKMTGLEKSTILKLLKRGTIKSIMTHPKYIIPKQYLLEFVATPRFIRYQTNSEHFLKILSEFEEWKAQQ
jgi:excisionase family DNA binding protein